jgi:hypothetical protein
MQRFASTSPEQDVFDGFRWASCADLRQSVDKALSSATDTTHSSLDKHQGHFVVG